MDARDVLRSGDVLGAMQQLKQEVRRTPRDAKLRTFLFQMFCVFAEWDRALNQLSVAAELDTAAIPMAQTYRAAIRCEMLRERVFAGQRSPTIFGQPEPWMSLLVEAGRLLADGHAEEASTLRDSAFEAAPPTSGIVDGGSFDWIADADPRLGPMLEAIVDGKYYWVPFHRLRSLTVEAPVDLRDQVWMPAQFTWANGGVSVGFVPTRYPGSAAAGADLATSRRTEWREQGSARLCDRGPRDPAHGHASARHDGRSTDRSRLTGSMATQVRRENLQPSLLDRLTDHAPDIKRESLDQQTLTMQQLRQAVLRDLTWLLNTTNHATGETMDGALASRSTLNFGIPGFTGLIRAASRQGPGRDGGLEAVLAEAIRTYEPRIRPDTVRVTARQVRDGGEVSSLVFAIEGELWAQPVPQQLFLETSIELETRLAVVTDVRVRN